MYSKTCVKQPLKNRQNEDLNDKCLFESGRFTQVFTLKNGTYHRVCFRHAAVQREWPNLVEK